MNALALMNLGLLDVPGFGPRPEEVCTAEAPDGCEQVLSVIKTRGPLRTCDICEALGLHKTSAERRLRKLLVAEVIVRKEIPLLTGKYGRKFEVVYAAR